MNALTEIIKNGLLALLKSERLVTFFVSLIPIVEARGAIPIGFGYGLSAREAFFFAFLGSSLITPLLLLFLIPFVRRLSRTRLFRKIGATLFERFEKRSRGIAKSCAADTGASATPATNSGASSTTPGASSTTADTDAAVQAPASAQSAAAERKKLIGIFLFVAVPLPLTGVWTASAIAAILKLSFPKALAAVVAGNLAACSLMTLLCALLRPYVDKITFVIGVAAIAVVILLIIKIIFGKPAEADK